MTHGLFPTEGLEQPPARPSARKEERDFVDQVMYWLRAPYITWPGYEDIYQANDNKNKALVRRLAHHQEIHRDKMCTEWEAMLYISTATLGAPPSHSWYRIYMYLFNKEMPEAAVANGLADVQELEGNEREDLMHLRRWIYKVQLLHLKQEKEAEAPAEVRRLKREVKVEKPRLFE